MMFGFIKPGGKLRATSAQIGSKALGNYLQIDGSGQIRLFGNASQWTDFSVPLNRSKQGQNEKPDYDFTELGLLFPQNNTNETIDFIMQMQHQKALQTNIYMHVHYRQTGVAKPVFTLLYRFYNNGQEIPSVWTTLNTSDEGGSSGAFPYTSGIILQIAKFPAIPAPLAEGVSANLDVKFYRNDNLVTGDVLTKYVDFHFAIDSLGSNEEYVKY
jgi:hypothetical protein